MKRKIALLVALLVVLGVVAQLWRPWEDDVPDDAVFVMGDEVVTIADLDRRNDSLRALYGVQEPLDDKDQADFRRRAAKSMAISLVLDSAVEDASIEVPGDEVDKALHAFVDAQFDGDREAFLEALGNVSSSEDAVRDEIRRQLELRLLLREVAGDVHVSDAELRSAFADRRASLGTPQRRVVSNLVLATRRDAADARRRLAAGVPVALLARTVSIDAATRDKGGALGAVTRAELVPSVGDAVFGARPGTPYGPVQGPQGWNVGVVTRVIAPQPATYAGVHQRLRGMLESELAQQRWSDWLEDELRDADIEYAASYRPSEPYDVSAWEQQAGVPAK
jgi:peptidyl-prolyl cis-trans isomerase C